MAAIVARPLEESRRTSRGLADVRVSNILWLLAFNLLLFQSWIQNTFDFSYVDEAITLVLLVSAVTKIVKGEGAGLGEGGCLVAAFFALICAIGLTGNVLWDVQAVASAIAIDFFTCVKFPIALLSAFIVFRGNTELFKLIECESKLLIVLMGVLACANLAFDFGMGTDPRYGLRASFVFVMGHPAGVVAVCAGLICVLCCNRERNGRWIMLGLLVVVLSLRSKGFIFAALVVFLLMTFGGNKLSVFHIMAGLVIAVLVGYDQFLNYFVLNDGYARKELLATSLQVASDFFPLGSGFATYGSAVTGDLATYSPLYYHYGLSTVYGLMPGNAAFLSDTFWPIVIGQFGWFGALAYVGEIVFLFKKLYESARVSRLSVLLCFAYLLISSFAESAFFHPLSVMLAMSLGVSLAGGANGDEQQNGMRPNA